MTPVQELSSYLMLEKHRLEKEIISNADCFSRPARKSSAVSSQRKKHEMKYA